MSEVKLERRWTPASELEFVGCHSVRVTAEELEKPEWEGRRVEYWDAALKTAWMVSESVTFFHEAPGVRLTELVTRICLARGSPARCIGSTDLQLQDDDGKLTAMMQADQVVYLNPIHTELQGDGRFVVDADVWPDVVLEVDNTTDVRRGKLVAYQEWGFPEVWVEIPDRRSKSRPRGLRPGLRIHLLDEEGVYREASESRSFPGWRAEEIHEALNESELSPETEAALWRVGRGLGRREGTEPEDDLLVRRVAEAATRRGVLEGRTAGVLAMARGVLAARGVPLSPQFADRLAAAVDDDPGGPRRTLATAAAVATSEEDFFARLDETS